MFKFKNIISVFILVLGIGFVFSATNAAIAPELIISVEKHQVNSDYSADIYWNTNLEVSSCSVDINPSRDMTNAQTSSGYVVPSSTGVDDGRFYYSTRVRGLTPNTDYYYQVVCTYNNVVTITDINELDTYIATSLKPDLMVEKIHFGNLGNLEDRTGELYVVIKNVGGDLTSSQGLMNWYNNFYSQGFVHNENWPSINDFLRYGDMPSTENPFSYGETIKFGWMGSFTDPGTFPITFTVDNADELDELDETNNSLTTNIVINPMDRTPRIMMWSGKVNQHWDLNDDRWRTDSDGVSGADIDKLEYCKKYYPNTESVKEYKMETSIYWKERGNTGESYTATKMSYECSEDVVIEVLPDLTVTSIDFSGKYVDEAGEMTVTVRNGGSVSITSDTGLSNTYFNLPSQSPDWQFDSTTPIDKPIMSRSLPTATNPLIPGEAIVYTWKGKFVKPHNYYVHYIVDYTKELAESNEKNNSLSDSIIIKAVDADSTPRVMFWSGKVNQHWNAIRNAWETDLDGVSGADLDKLTYCQKFFPETTKVAEYKMETTNTWRERGNVGGPYTSTKMSYECIAEKIDVTPRVMFWYGKVNQHWNATKNAWETDADGVSGANVDKLEYCKKYYPNTTKVDEHKMETTDTWKAAGNTGSYTSTKMSYKCIEGEIKIDNTPRVMYWYGKVNQHWNTGNYSWETDADGVSGADLDLLTYCKKFYPNTTQVEKYKMETTDTWKARGNTGSYTSTKMSYKCIEGEIKIDNTPRVMTWYGKVNQHWNTGNYSWETDADGVSGANVNLLSYCKKYYPRTTQVDKYKMETTDTWKAVGNTGSYKSTKMSYKCVQDKIIGFKAGESPVPVDIDGVVVTPSDHQITAITTSANRLHGDGLEQILSELKELRDTVKEQNTKIKYLEKLTKNAKKLTEKMETAISNFLTYGADENTKKLGEGERAAVMHSYKSAFDKLPETEAELADAIRIANGRWPGMTNEEAEKKAKEQFQKIYKRIADMNAPQDDAAVTVMAYGLRQKAENRNLESEKTGIKTFENIYGYHPDSTEDWNIMQAITYSGATRGVDTDGDLLTDEREAELGTDPNKKDTDGDGYMDGVEVANGFDPLSK